MNAVPSNADRARKTKKAGKFGASAVARLNKKNNTAVTLITGLRPNTWLMGPQTTGESPMSTM